MTLPTPVRTLFSLAAGLFLLWLALVLWSLRIAVIITLVVVAGVLVVVAVAAVPGALLGAVGSLLIGAWFWYRATVKREARGGHLWWPGRIEDRWTR